jgi:hypothetical protein
MSKPIVRVTVFVLISLVLIAATSVSVRGWLSGTGESEAASLQSHSVDGLQTNLNHDRSTSSELETLQMQSGNQSLDQPGKGHGCESEAQSNPNDF